MMSLLSSCTTHRLAGPTPLSTIVTLYSPSSYVTTNNSQSFLLTPHTNAFCPASLAPTKACAKSISLSYCHTSYIHFHLLIDLNCISMELFNRHDSSCPSPSISIVAISPICPDKIGSTFHCPPRFSGALTRKIP